MIRGCFNEILRSSVALLLDSCGTAHFEVAADKQFIKPHVLGLIIRDSCLVLQALRLNNQSADVENYFP
jgi:hypothetical protein